MKKRPIVWNFNFVTCRQLYFSYINCFVYYNINFIKFNFYYRLFPISNVYGKRFFLNKSNSVVSDKDFDKFIVSYLSGKEEMLRHFLLYLNVKENDSETLLCKNYKSINKQAHLTDSFVYIISVAVFF